MKQRTIAFIETMHPAAFALVMATGIVSVACHLFAIPWVPRTLLWANVVFYLSLWIFTAMRLVRFPSRVLADLSSHARAVGFFTMVAATCVLGTQVLLVESVWQVAVALWVFGILLWAAITYTVFTALIIKAVKPAFADGINGGWLVAVVAAQSVSVLGSQLAAGMDTLAPAVLLFSLCMWLGGGMLYIWIISLIFYRYTFFTMSPSDLSPPYWINMGAVAISTLAGATLVGAAAGSPLLQDVMPFLKGFTLLFWATATWWIPMLVIFGIWRHVYRRFPLTYDPLYWGAVFPLGMYTVCTFKLSQAIDAPFLLVIPRVFLYIAITAWSVTMFGMLKSGSELIFGGQSSDGSQTR